MIKSSADTRYVIVDERGERLGSCWAPKGKAGQTVAYGTAFEVGGDSHTRGHIRFEERGVGTLELPTVEAELEGAPWDIEFN